MNNLVVILLAISIHYIEEYMSEHPGYECPKICDVDHIHLTKEKEDVKIRTGSDRYTEGKQGSDSGLHKQKGKHSSSQRSQ